MKKGKTITFKQTCDAAYTVQNELESVGLWHEGSRLLNVEIVWCIFPQMKSPSANGFFLHGTSKADRLLGYRTGHIYIPKFVLLQMFWQDRGSLRDVIRHEYGHAFAHYYPDLTILSEEFEKVFGGNYFCVESSYMGPDAYFTEYSRTLPMEDFAETFMVYVRRKGQIPPNIKNRKLKSKWNYVSKLIKSVHSQNLFEK